MTILSGYYQLPEGALPAGLTRVEADLINISDGQLLYASGTSNVLTAEVDEVIVSSGTAYPVVVASNQPILNVTQEDNNQSEVSETILGIPKEERQLGLFSVVNSYGANPQYWRNEFGGFRSYNYYQDPVDYTFDGDYGYYEREVKSESALQAYCFPKPQSFTFPFNDGTGRFPGGYTDGRMRQFWETKRSFRYQPGRITGVTMGVRMSVNSQHDGEVITWGTRNRVGDGYFFQLERGTDLYVVRTSPDLGTLKIPRDQWNGDPVTIGENSATNWSLDLSKVTMFAIQFGWYGAVGAQFLAYVPISYRDSRWVVLHTITASDEYEVPSLRSPFLKIFVQAFTTAGTTQPAFINIYGSSVYIDGGDEGTLYTGSSSLEIPKFIDATDRSIMGLQLKPKINDVTNQQNIFPINLGLRSDVDAKVTLAYETEGLGHDVNYSPGFGTVLSRGSSSTIPVTRLDDVTLSGSFPDISAELSGTLDYRQGRVVKLVGNNIFRTHVIDYDPVSSTIIVDEELPPSVTSVRLSRFNASALSSGVISSGVTEGTLYWRTGGGYWRLGLVPNATNEYDAVASGVCWFASKYPGLRFNSLGSTLGEREFPLEPYLKTGFTVITGAVNTTISAGQETLTVAGVDPYPIKIVAELQDDATVQDIVFSTASGSNLEIPGSGQSVQLPSWTTSGVSQSSALAGGITYVASQFEEPQNRLNSAALVDKQGYRVLRNPDRVATYYIQSGEAVQYNLNPMFGPDKMFIGGEAGTIDNTGALFVTASARTGSGYIFATLDWEEQP